MPDPHRPARSDHPAHSRRPAHPFASKHPQPAIRLGLAAVRALGQTAAERVEAEREAAGPFTDLEDFVRRTDLPKAALEALATAGAFACFGLTRRQALWQAGALAGTHAGHLPGTAGADSVPKLPEMTVVEQTFADLWAAGASPDSHPIAHVREQLKASGHLSIAELADVPNSHLVRIAGIVTHRQRPPTAGGVCFLSLEDETGLANIVCSATVWEQQKKVALNHGALRIIGHLERSDHGAGAINIVAGRLEPLRVAAQPSTLRGRDFR